MIITYAFIHSGKSEGGGWSKAQLQLLGVAWPPQRGWQRRLLGTEMEDMAAKQFLAMRKTKCGLAKHLEKHSSRDQAARDYANREWEHNRGSFER